jgi:signal transduction histidine kinase
VWLRSEEHALLVGVEDDGCGFDAARLGKYSADGAGFGLFSVREQLERAGATMTIDSTPGSGTRIMLSVPLQNSPETAGQKGLS